MDAARAQMTSAAINNLPDSAFAYIEPGGSKDAGGRTVPRSLRHFPIHDADHVRNALARLSTSPFEAKARPKVEAAAKKMGIGEPAASASRAEDFEPQVDMFVRSFPLQDYAVRSGGDGRVVEAYAAVFELPAEIVDGQGHYTEVIDRGAFDRAIGLGIQRVGVFYNHGMNLYGKPSDRFSVPIGTPEEIRADGKGLLTATRFAKTELGDEILELCRAGSIAGYSFTGRLVTSHPNRPPRGGYGRDIRSGSLPTVRRIHLGLQEYGPTPMPAYSQAEIVGVRAALLLDGTFREEVRAMLSSTPDEDQDDRFDSPDDSGQVADDQLIEHSVRQDRKSVV